MVGRVRLTLLVLTFLLHACASGGQKPKLSTMAWPEHLDRESTAETHKQAALDLLHLMPIQANLDALLDTLLKQQLSTQPALQQFEPEMRAFFAKHLSADAIREPIAALYVKHFSELELRQTVTFYQTPTGRRMMLEQPKLLEAGAAIGMRAIEEHKGELVEMIQKKLAAQPPSSGESKANE